MEAHSEAPEQIILDIDATDTPLHGPQEGRFGISEVKDGVLRTRKKATAPEIIVPLAELFD